MATAANEAIEGVQDQPTEPRFRRRVGLVAALTELWICRGLVRSLAERGLRARYKQALLGFGWALITPLALMTVFALFFQQVADVNTGGAPYSVYAYLGLIPWTFFSTSLSIGGLSLVSNVALLNKVYCPREVFPIASLGVAGGRQCHRNGGARCPDVLLHVSAQGDEHLDPCAIIPIQVAFTLGVCLIVSAVVLYFRDLRHALPLILQLGLFATPVAYSISAIPAQYQWIYASINPLAPVIDSYRRVILFGEGPNPYLGLAALTSAVLLFGGYRLFKRLETGFADIA